jgi:hypothetical protein
VIENLFDREIISTISTIVAEKTTLLFKYIKGKGLPFGIGVKNGFAEVVQRQANRYEVRMTDILRLESIHDEVTVNSSNDDLLLTYFKQLEMNSMLLDAVNSIFRDQDYRIIHQSCVLSFPGTEEQKWHSDGPHVSVTEYLPCHCFNVFIPLIDITEELGPTEIRPYTQHYTHDLTKGMLLAKLRKQIKPVVRPLLKKGDALLVSHVFAFVALFLLINLSLVRLSSVTQRRTKSFFRYISTYFSIYFCEILVYGKNVLLFFNFNILSNGFHFLFQLRII